MEAPKKPEKKISYHQLFCQTCMLIPHYSISIEQSGEIFINHKCIKTNIKRNIKDLYNDLILEKKCKCYVCNTNCDNICIKCNSFICNKCFKEHYNYYLINEKRINEGLVHFFDNQFICTIHLQNFTYSCENCKINLCDKCLKYHKHINNLDFKTIKIKSKNFQIVEEKINNIIITDKKESFSNLLLLLKLFKNCFEENKSKNFYNRNIILNYKYINHIITFIDNDYQQNKNKSVLIEDTINPEDNNIDLFDSFYSNEFLNYYNDLIEEVQSGNMNSFYKLKEIKDFYESKKPKKKKKNFFYNSNLSFYKLSLKNLSERLKNNILFLQNSIKSINLNFMINKIHKMYFEIKLEIEVLKFDYNQLKKICLELDKKMNDNIKRKIFNLLTEKIFDKYFDNIHPIQKSEYLICLSIQQLKKEIKKIDSLDNIDGKKQNYKIELEEKLKKALLLLNDKTKSDIDNINNNKITFEENSNNILFINKTNDEKEILKVILLNIFFLLKKKMKDKYNNSIHNETQGINEIIKDEEKKNEEKGKLKRKDNKKKEKNENDKYNINNNGEILCQKKFSCIKNIKKFKNHFNIKNEMNIDNISLYNINEEENNLSKFNEEEFKEYLFKIKELYDVSNEIDFESAISFIFYNDKSSILSKKPSYENSENFRNYLNNCLHNLEKSYEMNNFIKVFFETINYNLNFIKRQINTIINYLEDYKEYYKINDIFRKEFIKEQEDPLVILRDEKTNLNEEESFILDNICGYFILENYIINLESIKKKIQSLSIEDQNKDVKIKIEIIKYLDSLMEKIESNGQIIDNIWNKLNINNEFINNEDEKMKTIKDEMIKYFGKNNSKQFYEDFIREIKNDIGAIDFSKNDPQDLLLKPFLKQNDLLPNKI